MILVKINLMVLLSSRDRRRSLLAGEVPCTQELLTGYFKSFFMLFQHVTVLCKCPGTHQLAQIFLSALLIPRCENRNFISIPFWMARVFIWTTNSSRFQYSELLHGQWKDLTHPMEKLHQETIDLWIYDISIAVPLTTNQSKIKDS